jgi:hypothetical protein
MDVYLHDLLPDFNLPSIASNSSSFERLSDVNTSMISYYSSRNVPNSNRLLNVNDLILGELVCLLTFLQIRVFSLIIIYMKVS